MSTYFLSTEKTWWDMFACKKGCRWRGSGITTKVLHATYKTFTWEAQGRRLWISGARVPPLPGQVGLELHEQRRPFVGLLVGAAVWAQHRLRV